MFLAIGIIFRFAHLERKIYWHDEVFTSLAIGGRTRSDFVSTLFTGHEALPADLVRYQEIVPPIGAEDVVIALAKEDSQHPPVYYLLTYVWVRVFGNSVQVIRSLAALLSLLVFPAVYWLCLELFQSPLAGWVAIALLAVSPFQVVFAQEAREYGLWGGLTLLSSAAFLRALRSPNWRTWGLYTVMLSLSFYTALLSVVVAFGQGVYIVLCEVFGGDIQEGETLKINEKIKESSIPRYSRAIAYSICLAIAMVFFIPWIYVLINSVSLENSLSWTALPLPLEITVQLWILNLSRSFVDLNSDLLDLLSGIIIAPVLLLEGYALYFLCRNAPRQTSLFVLTLIGSLALFLILPDVMFGGQRSTVARYLIPCYLGLQLAVVYFMSQFLCFQRPFNRKLAHIVFASLLCVGLGSCMGFIQADNWWNKVINMNFNDLAAIVNKGDRPLFIGDGHGANPANILALSRLFDPDVQLYLLPEKLQDLGYTVPEISGKYEDIFLYNLPDTFRQQFQVRYSLPLELSFKDHWNEVWHTSLSR